MAENRPWSTKRKMKARSTRLVTARVSRATAEQEMSDSAADPSSFAPDTSSSSLVLALQPSQPVLQSQEEMIQHPHVVSAEPGVDSEYESDAHTFDADDAQEVFDDFILCLPLNDRRMLVVLLTESFRTRQRCGCCTRSWVDCWIQ